MTRQHDFAANSSVSPRASHAHSERLCVCAHACVCVCVCVCVCTYLHMYILRRDEVKYCLSLLVLHVRILRGSAQKIMPAKATCKNESRCVSGKELHSIGHTSNTHNIYTNTDEDEDSDEDRDRVRVRDKDRDTHQMPSSKNRKTVMTNVQSHTLRVFSPHLPFFECPCSPNLSV